MKALFTAIAALLLNTCVVADSANTDSTKTGMDSTAQLNAYYDQLDSLMQTFDYKSGPITLKEGIATVTVPLGFKFLEAKDAKTVLTKLWNNPPNDDIMGLLVPDSIDYFAPESWAISYYYDEDGHVNDDDAESIKYDELLEQMKTDNVENNVQREKEGYEPIELVGWAQSPFYDKATHKLHWAKELKFGTDSINTLNYNIRMLGRKGVLVMNIISGMDNITMVKSQMNKILASTNFNEGNRYEDFNTSTDKVAEYGIGALVAGGILAKTGVLAKIGLFFVKAWKIIAVGVVGLVAFIKKKFFGGKE